MPGFLNDGSTDAPQLRVYLNATIWQACARSRYGLGCMELIEVGVSSKMVFEGIQLTDEATPAPNVLPYCGQNRISTPGEAWGVAARHADRGDLCLTVYVRCGMEDDTEVARLVEAVLLASDAWKIPIFIETHRATIAQDVWRTVQITKRFPEVRFNGDFSHYYCGQELVYGDWETKLAFMEPIFQRTAFLHGRIASPGRIQVPIGTDLDRKPDHAHGLVDYLAHFKQMWVHAMRGFLKNTTAGSMLIFAPEFVLVYDLQQIMLENNCAIERRHDSAAGTLFNDRISFQLNVA